MKKGAASSRDGTLPLLTRSLAAHLPANADSEAAVVLEPRVGRQDNLALRAVLVRHLLHQPSLGVEQIAAFQAELDCVGQAVPASSIEVARRLLPNGQV